VAEALILDAEELNALARAAERSVLADRARAILEVAHEEVCRGGPTDAPVNRAMARRRGVPALRSILGADLRGGGGMGAKKLRCQHGIEHLLHDRDIDTLGLLQREIRGV